MSKQHTMSRMDAARDICTDQMIPSRRLFTVCFITGLMLYDNFLHAALGHGKNSDWCFTACRHKIGQFVPLCQEDYLLRRFRTSNEENGYTKRFDYFHVH